MIESRRQALTTQQTIIHEINKRASSNPYLMRIYKKKSGFARLCGNTTSK